MRRFLIYIILFLVFLIIYFLQSNFFNWFTIANIKPNLFVIFALFLGLYSGTRLSICYSAFMGFFLDIVLGKNLGIYTIALTGIALLGVYLDKNFSKDSRIIIMIMVAVATILFETVCYALNILIFKTNIEILEFIRILLIEVLFNVILTIILNPLIQKMGYKLEDACKEQKILTRYF